VGQRGHAKSRGSYFFSTKKEMKINNWELDFLYTPEWYQQSVVSDRMSYIVLRGRWCNIIVLNVYPPSKEKSDDLKDRFYKELG